MDFKNECLPISDEIFKVSTTPIDGVVKDPVCGMNVALGKGKPSLKYHGDEFHFCNPKCYDRFGGDPHFYLSGNKSKQAQLVPKNATYTCPMDPEVVQEGPGTCLVCGMALEPADGIAEGPNHELIDFTRRLWVSVLAAIPLLILTMGPMIGLPIREWFGEVTSLYVEFALATPVVLWAAWPFFSRGWTSVKTWNLNLWTLIMIGVGAAYIYSTIATFLPQLFPSGLQMPGGHLPVYFEAAVVIIALVFVGQVLELRARERTGHAIRALLDLAIEQASEHPLAEALAKGIEQRGIKAADIQNFKSVTGKGVMAEANGAIIAVGNLAMMNEINVDISSAYEYANNLQSEGKTVMFVAIEGKLAAMLAVADLIKPSEKQAVRDIQALGVKVIMATGDNEITAKPVFCLRL